MELQVPEMLKIRRWDGAARSCSPWDSLGRDPELWFRDGNCFVHLYAKGQSRRGPAFKLPLAPLLEAKCHSVVARFLARDGVASAMASLEGRDLDFLEEMSTDARIELYIPPPPMATREESLRYHLATRNFFAWVFRRSLVGEHLGTSFINLLNSMMGFRRPGEPNMDDLMVYLDEEGYLDMRGQPIHALAVLHFAEYFQSKKLYTNAFTHCVGMYDELFAIPEYQIITSVTRKLVRLAKSEMDLKLARAGQMLRNLLEDELSETHIGLSSGSRAHLDRFRTFLHGYFTTKFGYYPPQSTDTHCQIYERGVYLSMRKDLEALYEYLVDEGFTSSEQMPALAQGGICTLQSVHAFDMRNKYASLQHPLPLLPEAAPAPSSRRMSWLGRSDKLRPDQRLVTHATLLKATNKREPVILKNPLVVAYRKFEEDSIFSPLKVDRSEKVSQIDARKIRWILVYSTYQVLRNCTDSPPECRETSGIRYNIAVNTASLPPWKEGESSGGKRSSVIRRQTDSGLDWRLSSLVPAMPVSEGPVFSSDIQPDIDYLALSHRDDSAISSSSTAPVNVAPRCQSLKTRSFRRSLNIFYSSSSQSNVVELTSGSRNRMSTSFQEILVRGYGNGTKDVSLRPEAAEPVIVASPIEEGAGTRTLPKSKQIERLNTQPLTGRSPSTSSTSSNTSTATSGISEALSTSSASTAPSLHSNNSQSTWTVSSKANSQDISMSKSDSKIVTPPAVPRRNSRRKLLSALHPIPLRIRKGNETPPETEAGPPYDPNGWHRIDGTTTPTVMEEDEDSLWMGIHRGANGSRVDVWDQYAGVGGLTQAVPPPPIPEAARA
ncbi:hypothetical protein B0T16DRAFT_432360 [Cercophora newfieldiana]|uniref:DUF8004 domain-containing protein n=1 Tax=Cercophora newfieldiana TaxID=92897 RepID=A0AA39XSW5_9PEZI|nr:hypothetical protein B0T16DRAFT_432360 [Cercophora newfieldiana]